jgi:phenylacetaldehyde dehydrogenase
MTFPDQSILDRAVKFASRTHGIFIDGKWMNCSSGEYFPTINPCDESVIGEIAAGEAADIDLAVAAASKAFASAAWAKMKYPARRALLLAIADVIEANAPELACLEALDTGKTYQNALTIDVPSAVGAFRYYAGWSDKIYGTTNQIASPGEHHAYVEREPVGVVGMIIPWNFPFSLLAMKLAPALAAGCTTVIKPAEETSLSALRLAELLIEAGVPAGVVNVVTGDGRKAGAALAAHARVDKIAFTGSTEVGRHIIHAAAGNLKKVSLELGGKAPNIILPDADLDKAIEKSAMGAFFNAGQNCMALSRLIVHRDVHDQVVEGLVRYAGQLKIGGGMANSGQLGPLISEKHFARVADYVATGIEEGATVAFGGARAGNKGYFLEPTILTGCTNDMRVVREEIFGPVVVVQSFDDIDAVVESVNSSEYGLSGAVWTRDLSMAMSLAKRLRIGNLGINTSVAADRNLPVGGYRQSGWGRENAFDGISAFLETKAVVVAIGD